MRRHTILGIFIFTLAMAFVGASASPQKTYPVVTEIKDGIRTVTNPEYPRDGRFTAKLTLEMTCGEESAVEAATLNRPLDLRVDDRGFVYVMDWGDMHIKVYDAAGKFVRTIGRKGQGPGEFELPVWFSILSAGRVCIVDGNQRRVVLLNSQGEYLSMFSPEGFFRSVAVDGQDRIYLAKWGFVEKPKLSEEMRDVPYVTSIYRTEASGKEFAHLTDVFGESVPMKSLSSGGVVMTTGLYAVVWNVNRQGRIYALYNEKYSINAHGPDGQIEFSFGRAYKPVKNTFTKGPFAQKKYLPVFGESNHTIVFDDDGNLWIELYKGKENDASVYDVFSQDGTYLKQVKGRHRIFQFKKEKIYSIVESEDGYRTVKRFAMELVAEGR
jgi:hypothetical protein